MTFSARVLRVCAMLAVPTAAFAQSTKGPTIFSPTTQVGTVTLRAAVVLADYSVKPLPLLHVVAQRTDKPDSAAAETDLDGRVSIGLPVGTYTLRARTAQPVAGRSYSWAVRVVVRPQRTESVQMTNSNAVTSDSVPTTVVAEAAPNPTTATPAAPPTVTKAAAPRPSQPVPDRNKVVAKAEPTTQSSPFAAPQSSSAVVRAPAPVKRIAPKPSRTNTEGFLFGLAFDAASIRSEALTTSSTESGPGVGATFGWGFTRNFALVLDASAARISGLDGDFDLGHVDVGGRWHFVNRSALVPFVDVGYAGRAATKQAATLSDGAGTTYTGKLSIMGGGVSAGGGFQYFAMPGLALGGSFKWTSGKFTRVQFDKVTVDGLNIDATSARFNMGFTWYPSH
jgi:hypothetical protein